MTKTGLIIVAAATVLLTGGSAAAAAPEGDGVYPPDTVSTRSLDVSGFSTVCDHDVPFIDYEIVPVGFVPPTGEATLTIRDRSGAVVDVHRVSELAGRMLYPGAAVDSAGEPTDWPGWKRSEGQWIPDPTDAHLRDGLTIHVEVNPTAIARVAYPSATAACASPNGPAPTSAVNGQSATAAACPVDASPDCVEPGPPAPVQALRSPSGRLPATGSELDLVRWAVVLVAAGAVLTLVAVRRRHPSGTS